jgi:hypothetical protein
VLAEWRPKGRSASDRESYWSPLCSHCQFASNGRRDQWRCRFFSFLGLSPLSPQFLRRHYKNSGYDLSGSGSHHQHYDQRLMVPAPSEVAKSRRLVSSSGNFGPTVWLRFILRRFRSSWGRPYPRAILSALLEVFNAGILGRGHSPRIGMDL